jgi:hypothetical protein
MSYGETSCTRVRCGFCITHATPALTVFGRTNIRKRPDGRLVFARRAPEEWISFIRDAHEGYITWMEYEENIQRLRDNAQALGAEREKGPPREGPALLQGLVYAPSAANE